METVSQQELSHHLGVSDRRIRQLEVEQIIKRLDGEPVRYDLSASKRHYRIYLNHDVEAACCEVEEAAADVDKMLERLRTESNIEVRRQIAEKDGGAVGRLASAMALTNVLGSDHSRKMMETFTDVVVSRVVNELFGLCEWIISDDTEEKVPEGV